MLRFTTYYQWHESDSVNEVSDAVRKNTNPDYNNNPIGSGYKKTVQLTFFLQTGLTSVAVSKRYWAAILASTMEVSLPHLFVRVGLQILFLAREKKDKLSIKQR